MDVRHIRVRMQQVDALAKLSRCCRQQFGAMILDPERKQVLVDGYNGPPRGDDGDLCGGKVCTRELLQIRSGTQSDVGCYHAEQNAILNAANKGVALAGTWLFVQGEPCIGCARDIYHAGVKVVVIRGGGYTTEEGVEFLRKHRVEVKYAPAGNKFGVLIAPSLYTEEFGDAIAAKIRELMRAKWPLSEPYYFKRMSDVLACRDMIFVSSERYGDARSPLTSILSIDSIHQFSAPSRTDCWRNPGATWAHANDAIVGLDFIRQLRGEAGVQEQVATIANLAVSLFERNGGYL